MPYWRLFYHIVWGTKNRLALIDPAWEKDLHGYIWGKAIAHHANHSLNLELETVPLDVSQT